MKNLLILCFILLFLTGCQDEQKAQLQQDQAWNQAWDEQYQQWFAKTEAFLDQLNESELVAANDFMNKLDNDINLVELEIAEKQLRSVLSEQKANQWLEIMGEGVLLIEQCRIKQRSNVAKEQNNANPMWQHLNDVYSGYNGTFNNPNVYQWPQCAPTQNTGRITDQEWQQLQLDRMERSLKEIEMNNKTLYGKPLYKKW